MTERTVGSLRVARWVFLFAGIYGLIVLVPTYFMADEIGRTSVPLSHLEYYYGFAGVAVAWQFAFFIIASDVGRFRLFMLPAIVEKLAFSIPALLIAVQGKLPGTMLPFVLIDLGLAVTFTICFIATRHNAPKSGSA